MFLVLLLTESKKVEEPKNVSSKVVSVLEFKKTTKFFVSLIIFMVLIFGLFIMKNSSEKMIKVTNLEQPKVITTKDIYVSNTSKKNVLGTFESPFQTISEALHSAQKGSNILIRKGTYKEKLTLRQSGEKDAWISISNYPEEEVIIDGSDLPVSNDIEGLVTIKNKSFILNRLHLVEQKR